MCGITGFVDFEGNSGTKEILIRMTDAIRHRGPDDAGYELYKAGKASIGFGQRRLSILDLSPSGHQPMHFKHISVVFNGEIYNFNSLKKELTDKGYSFVSSSDTEVILKGYHCWGLRVIDKLIGMFAIVILDNEKQELCIVRDRAGVKPMYYYLTNNLVLFGSELKALYCHPEFKKDIDTNSLALYLKYGYIPVPYTIFKNTFKLKPGHIFTISLLTRQRSVEKYWDVFDFYNKPVLNIHENEAIEHTEQLLSDAYNLRMVADVPVGVFLSGGYDSSSVAAILQKDRTDRLKTFTIGFHESEFNEAQEAKKIAQYLGTDHTEMYVTSNEAREVLYDLPEIYDEPFADNSTIPTVLLSRLARKNVKVALSADGGDEIFAGYQKYSQALRYTQKLPFPLQHILSKGMSLLNPEYIPYLNRSFNFTHRFENAQKIWGSSNPVFAMDILSQTSNEKEITSLLKNEFSFYPSYFNDDSLLRIDMEPLNQLLAVDYKTFLTDNNMFKIDKATMSIGLEGREPMLDHRIIEFMAQLPASYKIRKGISKFILKEIVHKHIPKELMERPKKGFLAPIMLWFKNDLKDMLGYYLSENALNTSGIFNPKPVIRLKNDFLNGRNIYYQKLWQVLVFQLWYNRWIQRL